jgi:hypothetical protein
MLGTPLIVAIETGGLLARTGFMVARVMHTGKAMLFRDRQYEERVLGGSHGTGFADRQD